MNGEKKEKKSSSSSNSNKNNDLTLDSHTVIQIGGTYIRKMVGVDFMVKLLGYLVRFKILSLATKNNDPVALGNYKKLLGSIVESRMLSNAGKWPSTFLSATKTAEAPEDFVNKERNLQVPNSHELDWFPCLSNITSASPLKLISYIALLCRVLEQLSSDCGYLARYVFQSWDRDRLTVEYKRWKSFSLTLLVIIETVFLVRYAQQKLDARRQKKIDNKQNNNGTHHTSSGTDSSDELTSNSTSTAPSPFGSVTPSTSGSPDFPTSAYVAGSPSDSSLSHKRSASVVQFEKAKGVEEVHRLAVPALSSPKFKYRFQHIASGSRITNSDAMNSLIVWTRCVCDMYIYYRWIPSWNPPEFYQYSAGIVSAVLGIYLVMEETIGEVKKSQQKERSSASSKLLASAADKRNKAE